MTQHTMPALQRQVEHCIRSRDLKRLDALLDPTNPATPMLATLVAETVCHESLARGDEMLTLALDRGADPNHGNGAWVHAAADRQGYVLLEILLRAGADPNPPGPTPALTRALSGHMKSVQLLLEHGADANALNEYGTPPLWQAVRQFNPALVEMLLHHAANPHVLNSTGDTLLHVCAANAADPDPVRWEEDADGFREAMRAIVYRLGDLGVDPAQCNQQGVSALDMARDCAHLDPDLEQCMHHVQALRQEKELSQSTPTSAAASPRRTL